MASLGTAIGSGIISGSGGTVVATVSGSASVGDLVVVAFHDAAASHTFTVTDNSTGGPNTWTILELNTATTGPYSGALAYCFLTHALANGNTITATINTGTPGGRMYSIVKYPAALLAGTVDAHTLSDSPTTATQNPTKGYGNTLGTAPNVVVGLVSYKNGTGTTTFGADAAWNQITKQDHTGTTTAHMGLFDQTETATTAPTMSPTGNAASDAWSWVMVAFPRKVISMTAASSPAFTGAAAMTVTNHVILPTAAASVTFTGAATMSVTHHVATPTAAASVSFTGAAAMTITAHSTSMTAAASVTFTGAATASITHHVATPTAAATVTFTGAATMTIVQPVLLMTATGHVSVTGAAAVGLTVNMTARSTVSFTGAAKSNGQLPPVIFTKFDPLADIDTNFL